MTSVELTAAILAGCARIALAEGGRPTMPQRQGFDETLPPSAYLADPVFWPA